jgi:hypothetical protein
MATFYKRVAGKPFEQAVIRAVEGQVISALHGHGPPKVTIPDYPLPLQF